MRFQLRRKMRPGEVIQRGIDFSGDMDPSDAIISVIARATEKLSGADVSATVVRDAIITGRTTAKATIQNLQDGIVYLVAFKVTTGANAEGFEHDIEIPASASA